LARCDPNHGFDRAPLTALRVVTAVKDGSAAMRDLPAGCEPTAAKADKPPGEVEHPPALMASPPSASSSATGRAIDPNDNENAISYCARYPTRGAPERRPLASFARG
jgi:hypothetical protein